ncbi:hypothetical protein [Dendronalium sp. ChiSLP03b]|nr:hypothetical protein [Dendronalium sp. ChiSLP03b]MDZ8208352.1 hypothetical protein [Dendronalium sp. ChiSLP03b]
MLHIKGLGYATEFYTQKVYTLAIASQLETLVKLNHHQGMES